MPDQRRNLRVPCSIPVRVLRPPDWLPLTLLDLSRTGARFGVGSGDHDVAEPATLGMVAEHLNNFSQIDLVVDLDSEQLDARLRRSLHIVRIGLGNRPEDVFEIGTTFDRPLTAGHMRQIGVPVPPEAMDEEPTLLKRPRDLAAIERSEFQGSSPLTPMNRKVPPKRPMPHGLRTSAAPSFAVSLTAYGRGVTDALRGHVEELTPAGGTVTVFDPKAGQRMGDVESLVDRVAAFDRAYGSDVDLTIETPERFLFNGPVTLRSVGYVPEFRERLVIGFAFQRDLEHEELASLQLLAAAEM